MKKIFILSIYIILITICCSKNKNPFIVNFEQNNQTTYIGKPGTERTYKIVEKWYHSNTTIPFISIPDSIKNDISLSDSFISCGVVRIMNYTEFVTSINTDYFNRINQGNQLRGIPLLFQEYPIEEYRKVEGDGTLYDLTDEIDHLCNNLIYTPSNYGIGVEIYHENQEQLSRNFTRKILDLPILLDKEWIRYSRVDSLGNIEFEVTCKIIGIESVLLSCGNFEAYKLEVMDNWGNGGKSLDCYEYYVPNIGLILEESDRNLGMITADSEGNISNSYFRLICRKELVNYNILY